MKYFLLLLLPLQAYGQDYGFTEEELNPETEEILIRKPEKFLRDESMIYELNTELGIKDQRRYTGTDRNRFSMAGHLSAHYEQLTEILGIEVAYMRRSRSYNKIWYGGHFFRHKTYFDAISENPAGGTSPNADSAFVRPGNVDNTVMGAGLGVGYRFKFLLHFYPTEDVFETVDVFVNGIQLDETFLGRNYRGFGLTTNYGIHKRSGTSFFYGGKISYNVASVTREPIAQESRSERSLSLGWLSLAFELGYFY